MSGTAQQVAIQLISTGGYYGAERTLVELASYLADRGWESHVVALEGAGAAELVQQATARGLIAEAFVPHGRLGLRPMLRRLRQLEERYPGAVLHSHGYKPDMLLTLSGATRRTRCIATCHNWVSDSAKMRLIEALDKRALRGFPQVVGVSDAIAAELRRSGVPARSVSVIHNGITPPQAEAGARARVRAEFSLSEAAQLLVHVGRLARSKRIDVLLQSLAALPPAVQLLLVGDGAERGALQERAASAQLRDRVHFLGYRRDIAELLAAADVFALSSEREGLPIAVLEAMASGTPIVATRVGSIPQMLEDGRDAWLVAAGDAAALAASLREALADPMRAHARAQAAKARFAALYSRDAMGVRYLDLYQRLPASKAHGTS
jgi:glycosyltransferase involved in cell wall biosynthesis